MSWIEDHYEAFVDEIIEGRGGWCRRAPLFMPPRRFACKFCGEPGLSWVEVRVGVWRPAKGSHVHECKRVPKSAAADVADLV